ncbi:type II toxin-antitoxin system YafO family toxin [Microbulbifer sp. A4B17]|uniref:type II toxin-antitoxin system YafO family toxin n=1 Tax=Microbulbifer sp. A4B17 TaxID=359370 RepID=UPI00192D814C|nr:type II toxin-antitoxin system YafO family toxin [Microbulbifer sp. A4B17]
MKEGTIKVFVRKELDQESQSNSDLRALISDFKRWKSGNTVHYFGKDVPYHDPKPYAERAKLRHVHILDKVKTVHIRAGTSDSALIYTEASMTPNTYYVIDFIAAGAHQKARDFNYMNWLIDKAEQFRMRK